MRLAASVMVCGLMLAGGSPGGLAADEVPQARIEAQPGGFRQLRRPVEGGVDRGDGGGRPDRRGRRLQVDGAADRRPCGGEDRLEVGRTSLKTRNRANAPDAWEAEVLRTFAARKAAGEDPGKMEAWAIADNGGQKRFRYMKAIPMASLCLTCHGTQIDPELRAHLDKLYPDDAAVGYGEGDIRAAFTISQPM